MHKIFVSNIKYWPLLWYYVYFIKVGFQNIQLYQIKITQNDDKWCAVASETLSNIFPANADDKLSILSINAPLIHLRISEECG